MLRFVDIPPLTVNNAMIDYLKKGNETFVECVVDIDG